MNLKDWAADVRAWSGVEQWARRRAAAAIDEVAPDQDGPAFAEVTGPDKTQKQLTLRVWAALPAGLAAVEIVTDPVSEDAKLTLKVESWSTAGGSLWVESQGEAEDQQTITLHAGSATMTARKRDREALLELYREAAKRAGG